MNQDHRLSDRARDEFIVECMRFSARVDLMAALDNLRLSLRRARGVFMPQKVRCDICENSMLIEDSYTCDRCGKSVCADHIVCQKLAEDDFENVCTDCLEEF